MPAGHTCLRLCRREQRDRAIDSKIRHMAEIQVGTHARKTTSTRPHTHTMHSTTQRVCVQTRLKYQLESQFAYFEQLLIQHAIPFIEFDDTHMEQMLLDTDVDVEMS